MHTGAEGSEARERIIAEATRQFVAGGYNGISMREIAAGVGISKPGLYYHFRDKEDLFLAILNDNLELVGRLVAEAGAAGITAEEQVTIMWRSIFRQPPEQRALIRLASQEMRHLGAEACERFAGVYREKFIAPVEAIVQGGVDRRELRPMNVPLATWMLLGMAYPFLDPTLAQEAGWSDRAIELLVAIFFEGARRPPAW